MSLPHFLHENLDDILAEWERESGASPAEQTARRFHFGKVLRAVAEEMKRSRAAEPQPVPRRGRAPAAPHTEAGQLVGDYASLRASVVRQWRTKHPSPSPQDLDDLVRFNEAMDRSLAELTATFSPAESQPHALFLGVLNHELRTSVASILMSAQVLTHRSAPGSPEAKGRSGSCAAASRCARRSTRSPISPRSASAHSLRSIACATTWASSAGRQLMPSRASTRSERSASRRTAT